MPSHDKGVNKNQLKLAAITRYGVSGMRWGECPKGKDSS